MFGKVGKLRLVIIACFAILVVGANAFAGSIDFSFQFDNSGGGPDGIVASPIVGTGSFSIANDPGLGTFELDQLGSFTMNFDFGAQIFTDAQISSDPSMTLVVISQFAPGVERVYFSDYGFGANGPSGGSLDLGAGLVTTLSFEPTYAGGHSEYFVGGYFGNYLGTTNTASTVPEPSSLALLGLGGIGLIVNAYRRRRANA